MTLSDCKVVVAGAGSCHSCGHLTGVVVVAAGSIVNSCHYTGQAGLADAVHHIPQVLLRTFARLLSLLPLPLVTVSVGDVGLQISATQVGSPASVVAIPATANCAEEDIAQARLLHPGHLVVTPGTKTLLTELLGAAQTEHVLAGNHPTVDQDGLQTFVTGMNHRVENLLAHQVD